MQDIIASLPESVLNFKDHKGRTIIDWEFNPFTGMNHTENIADGKNGMGFIIDRPHYITEDIECRGDILKIIIEKVEGNIQEAIDNKVTSIYIRHDDFYDYPVNSIEDDVYKLLDAGYIQFLYTNDELKSNGKQYHVDFMNNKYIDGNITSYYNYGRETAKTVALREPIGAITNNLISLNSIYISTPHHILTLSHRNLSDIPTILM